MRNDAAESRKDFPQVEVEQRDPQSIADLIAVLNQDLAEPQKTTSAKPR